MIDKTKYVVLDTETNGLDPIYYDLLSLAIYKPDDEKSYHHFFPLHRNKHINEEASKINGITMDDLKDAKDLTQEDINNIIKEYELDKRIILVYGSKFDESFINIYFKRHKLIGNEKFTYFNIKDLFITCKYAPDGLYTKDNLCNAFGIEGVKQVHSAINDCILEWKLFEKTNNEYVFVDYDKLYRYNCDYCVPATTINAFPKFKKLIKSYPNINIDVEEKYKLEKELETSFGYIENYLYGIALERILSSKLSANECINSDYLNDNKNKLEFLCNMEYPTINYQLFFDENNLVDTKSDNSIIKKQISIIREIFKEIDIYIEEAVSYIKSSIFNNEEIKSQELIVDKNLNAFALCDFSSNKAVLEVKGNFDFNLNNAKIQLYLESNNRPIYLLKSGIVNNKFVLTISNITFRNKKIIKDPSFYIEKIRKWRNDTNNIDNNDVEEIMLDAQWYFQPSCISECSKSLALNSQTVKKYWAASSPKYNLSKKEIDEIYIEKKYKYVNDGNDYFCRIVEFVYNKRALFRLYQKNVPSNLEEFIDIAEKIWIPDSFTELFWKYCKEENK